MSKAVKSIGRAIGKIVKGVVNVVKKVASSKIGKILLVAATVYFGGAALMGGLSGASAGTGVMGTLSGAVQGAATGVANAWTGLTGAAGSAMSGNFATAGSQLSAGFQGTTMAAGQGLSTTAGGMTGLTAPSTAATTGGTAANYSLTAGTGGAGTGLTAGASTLAPSIAATAPAAAPGMFASMSPLAQYGVISGGTQLAGGLIQGAGQQKAMEEQRNYELEQQQAARDRYNQNAGTMWWGNQSGGQASGDSSYASSAPTGLVQTAMTPQEQYAQDMQRRLATYDPYRT